MANTSFMVELVAGKWSSVDLEFLGTEADLAAGKTFVELQELTAPASPSTNRVRIYAEDNGAGKTRLMAKFATGAAAQIAIEP